VISLALLAQQGTDPFQVITDFLESPLLRIVGQLVLLLFVVLWVALVYWTYTDAERRGAMSIFWGIVAVSPSFVSCLNFSLLPPPHDRSGEHTPRTHPHLRLPLSFLSLHKKKQ